MKKRRVDWDISVITPSDYRRIQKEGPKDEREAFAYIKKFMRAPDGGVIRDDLAKERARQFVAARNAANGVV